MDFPKDSKFKCIYLRTPYIAVLIIAACVKIYEVYVTLQ